MTVDLRVEVGIVIHFKLAIELKCFPTRPEIKTETAQTCIEIIALLCQACGITGPVTLRPYLFLSDEEKAAGRLAPRQIARRSGKEC